MRGRREQERAARHRGMDLAREGFPSWGEGGGGDATRAGPSVAPAPSPAPRAPGRPGPREMRARLKLPHGLLPPGAGGCRGRRATREG